MICNLILLKKWKGRCWIHQENLAKKSIKNEFLKYSILQTNEQRGCCYE